MDGASASSSNSLRVSKLLPKSISKRRRRKEKNAQDSEASGHDQNDDARSTSAHSSRRRFKREPTLESDDTNSINMADDDDMDDRSFGSLESGADPENTDR